MPGEGEGRLVRVLIRGPKCRHKVGRLPGTVDGVIIPADFWLLELVERGATGWESVAPSNCRWAPWWFSLAGCLQRAVLCKSSTFWLEAHQVDKRNRGSGDAPGLLSKGINMGSPVQRAIGNRGSCTRWEMGSLPVGVETRPWWSQSPKEGKF